MCRPTITLWGDLTGQKKKSISGQALPPACTSTPTPYPRPPTPHPNHSWARQARLKVRRQRNAYLMSSVTSFISLPTVPLCVQADRPGVSAWLHGSGSSSHWRLRRNNQQGSRVALFLPPLVFNPKKLYSLPRANYWHLKKRPHSHAKLLLFTIRKIQFSVLQKTWNTLNSNHRGMIWFRPDMGKLQPGGHMQPMKLFNLDRHTQRNIKTAAIFQFFTVFRGNFNKELNTVGFQGHMLL